MSTADKLQTIINTKAAIRQAILDKGVVIADSDTFASYPNKIANIESGGSIPDGTKFAYSRWETIPDIIKSYLPSQTNWNSIFEYSLYLKSATGLDASNVTDLGYMFNMVLPLETVTFTNTSKATSMYGLFFSCSKLKIVDGLDFSSIGGNVSLLSSNTTYTTPTFNITNLGKKSTATKYDFKPNLSWSYDSMIYSLLTNSYDRATNGMTTAVITLASTAKDKLTDLDIAAITAKGYTIT